MTKLSIILNGGKRKCDLCMRRNTSVLIESARLNRKIKLTYNLTSSFLQSSIPETTRIRGLNSNLNC